MKILVACEESQAVTIAMRAVGAEAYSCDIQAPSGGHPEWHILGDALQLINGDCAFRTMDGTAHEIVGPWRNNGFYGRRRAKSKKEKTICHTTE